MTNFHTVLERWTDFSQIADPYLQPIETHAQHQTALGLLEIIWEEVGENSHSPLAGLFELLLERIKVFESRQVAIADAPAHQVLEFLLQQHQITQTALAAATGIQQSNISAILHQKRQLTLEQLKILAAYFRVSPMAFL